MGMIGKAKVKVRFRVVVLLYPRTKVVVVIGVGYRVWFQIQERIGDSKLREVGPWLDMRTISLSKLSLYA